MRWANKSGKTIEAVFVKLDGAKVIVRKDGKDISIDLNSLDDRSAALARQMAAVGDFGK